MKFLLVIFLTMNSLVFADEFSVKDIKRWDAEFEETAKYGRQLWENSATVKLGSNKVACAQCHPNAANTHPETYPKFQKQIGKVVYLTAMINWCIRNPLEGKEIGPESKEMTALLAYIYKERKGVKLSPGKH